MVRNWQAVCNQCEAERNNYQEQLTTLRLLPLDKSRRTISLDLKRCWSTPKSGVLKAFLRGMSVPVMERE